MNRNYHLDNLKGIAIVMIIISHCYSILFISDPYVLSLFSDLGRWGVLIFLLISGYLDSLKRINNYSLINQLKNIFKKIKKFYFLYIVTMIVMVIIYLYYNRTDDLIAKIISNVFLIQSYIPYGTTFAYSLNTPSWYLSMMLLCWFVSPYFLKIKDKMNHKIVGFIIVYLGLGFLLYINKEIFTQYGENVLRYFMYVNPVVNVFIYFLGMLGIKECSEWLKNRDILKVIIVIFAMISYLTKDCVAVDFRVYYLLIPTLFLVAVICGFEITNQKFGKFISFLGKNSMILMLVHYPFCYIMRKIYKGTNVWFFIVTLLYIYLSFIIILYISKVMKRK